MTPSFNKQGSIRNKIMIPFMVVIGVVACASITICVFTLSELMHKHIDSDLTQDQRILHQTFTTIQYELNNIQNLLAYTKKISPDEFKKILPNTNKTPLLNWQDLRIFTSPSQLPAIDFQRYKAAFASPMPLTPYLYSQFESLQLSFVGSIKHYSKRIPNPVVMKWTLSDETLRHIQSLLQSELALIYYTDKDQLVQSELLTASSEIQQSIELQHAIKQLLSKKTTTAATYSNHTIGKKKYLMTYQQTPWHPNLYSVVLMPNNVLFMTKLKITLSIMSVLLVISLFVYAIYALIIQKLTTSIDILSSVSKKVSDGDLNQHVYLESNDEIGELAYTFNAMIHHLNSYAKTLKDEMKRSEAIISSIPEGIIVTDFENRLILANEKAESMFNFSGNEIKGKRLLEHISNEDLINVLNAEKTDKPIMRDVEITTSSGENRIYCLTSSCVASQSNKALGVITILRDLTYDRQMEELREGFLRTVSHELRTPLTSVIGFIEIVMTGVRNNLSADQFNYLGTALKEAKSLKALIDDLLDLSQFKAGNTNIKLKEISIKELIDSLVTTMSPLIKGKDLTLKSTIKKPNLTLFADESKLRRIFLNLISNAVKFTNKGSIIISSKETEKEILISISDTGIGLRDNEKNIIFEKFRQVDYSSRRKYEGIGLGLSIVKELIEMHHGKITVKSTYGKGSTFTVHLPIKP